MEALQVLSHRVDRHDERLTDVEGRVDTHERILDGDGRELGLTAKVHIVWRSYVWLLCTVSAAAGSFLTWLAMRG
jgi:hypothetical protein